MPIKNPEGVNRACDLYRTGISFREAADACGVNRETVRLELVKRGLIRGRLSFHPPLHERLYRGIDKRPNGCWIWTGTANNMGYGTISVAGKRKLVHRVVFEQTVGPIPEGKDACHRCDTPACCNPDHVFIGTRLDNMRDAARKGRTLSGERAPNAKLNDEIVREIRTRHAAGEVQRRIAEDTGVDYRRVNAIALRRAWRSVA
jgi:HNH endonuclease